VSSCLQPFESSARAISTAATARLSKTGKPSCLVHQHVSRRLRGAVGAGDVYAQLVPGLRPPPSAEFGQRPCPANRGRGELQPQFGAEPVLSPPAAIASIMWKTIRRPQPLTLSPHNLRLFVQTDKHRPRPTELFALVHAFLASTMGVADDRGDACADGSRVCWAWRARGRLFTRVFSQCRDGGALAATLSDTVLPVAHSANVGSASPISAADGDRATNAGSLGRSTFQLHRPCSFNHSQRVSGSITITKMSEAPRATPRQPASIADSQSSTAQ